jgi:zinc-ribbon domain
LSTPAPAAIPIHCEDAQDWPGIVRQIQASGSPVDMTPAGIGQLVSLGVMAQFAADASGQFTALKGLFSDQVIASVGRHVHSFDGAVPQSVSMQLVGLPADHGPGQVTLRIRLKITVLQGGATSVVDQFWDITEDQPSLEMRTSCPNCGAPAATANLVCPFCGTDLRVPGKSGVVVTKVQLY